MPDVGLDTVDVDSLRDVVPADLSERQTQAWRDAQDADLWATNAPACLACGAVNLTAYGGAKKTFQVDGVELVAETCHQCEQATIQVLDVDQDGDDDD